MPVSRTQALHLLNRGRVFYLRRRRGGALRRGIGDAQAVRACFPEAPSGCPKRSEGGFPATARRKYTQHRIQNIQRTTEDHHPSQTKSKTKKLNTKALIPKNQGFICARYWDRTSDLFRVREARYRCANRAHKTVVLLRGEDGIRTRVHGFAGRCLTTRPPHRIRSTRERVRTLGVLTSG